MVNISFDLKNAGITLFALLFVFGLSLTAIGGDIPEAEKSEVSAFLLENFNIAEEISSQPEGSSSADGLTAIPLANLEVTEESLGKGMILGVFLYGEENVPYLLFSASLPDEYSSEHAAGLFSENGQVKHVTGIEVKAGDGSVEIPTFSLAPAEESGSYVFELLVDGNVVTGTVPGSLE